MQCPVGIWPTHHYASEVTTQSDGPRHCIPVWCTSDNSVTELQKGDECAVQQTEAPHTMAWMGAAYFDDAYWFSIKFRRCVIIDCFEVLCQKPSNLRARAQTWSNYKYHNTVKFLIGVAPQCVISFISEAWGGCVSDVYLTESSGLLERLQEGDVILADGVQHPGVS